MEKKKLSELFVDYPFVVEIIFKWVDKDLEAMELANAIKASQIPEKREELLKKYIDLFYSLL